MFKYSYNNKHGNIKGSCSGNFGTGYDIDVFMRLEGGEFCRFIRHETEDEFGIYKTLIMHNITDGNLTTIESSFKNHPEIRDKELEK